MFSPLLIGSRKTSRVNKRITVTGEKKDKKNNIRTMEKSLLFWAIKT